MANRLDVIIFGASGFTGKQCVVEAVRILQNFTWAIAGRNKEKLTKMLKEIEEEIKTDLSRISIVIADANDEKSLIAMAEQAKVIINLCGPYRYYGEAVVKACVNAGTHHLDISAEPQYMERMQLEYDSLAKQKGTYVVSACAFASVPADLGVAFVEKNFDGEVNSVEIFLEIWFDGPVFGAVAHYATWESLLLAVAHSNELSKIRSKLDQKKFPECEPKLKRSFSMLKSAKTNSFYFPFPGIDESVVHRSQRILYETERKRPVQVKAYLCFRSFFLHIGAIFGLLMLFILTRCSCGLSLLLKFPKVMSLGLVTHEGPSKERLDGTKIQFSLFAEGWSKTAKPNEASDEYSIPPNKKLAAKVSSSNDLGYGCTCIAVLVAATTILREKEKMPSTGGVYYPGAAFAKTNIFDEMEKQNGFRFEIVKN